MQTVWPASQVDIAVATSVAKSTGSVGAEVISESLADFAATTHGGAVKVGIAVIPLAHSTQVLHCSQYEEI